MEDWSPRGAMVFVDGRGQLDTTVRIAWDDPGLAGGLGAFETLPILDGQPLFCAQHLDRLARSCALLHIPVPDLGSLDFQISMALAAWGVPEGVLRIQRTAAGRTIIGLRPAGPTRSPLTVCTQQWPSPPFPPARAKHTSRAGARLARQALGADEVFRTDDTGAVLEGTWSNVFRLSGTTLHTCPDDGRILAGITRAALLDQATALGLGVERTAPRVQGPPGEWFVTSSLSGLVFVEQLDGVRLPAPSPTLLSLRDALFQATGRTPPPA